MFTFILLWPFSLFDFRISLVYPYSMRPRVPNVKADEVLRSVRWRTSQVQRRVKHSDALIWRGRCHERAKRWTPLEYRSSWWRLASGPGTKAGIADDPLGRSLLLRDTLLSSVQLACAFERMWEKEYQVWRFQPGSKGTEERTIFWWRNSRHLSPTLV